MTAPARYATRPTPGACNVREYRRLAMIMDGAGAPLMPWQRQVARVATELHPAGVGWRYKTVIVTVPRQCGKSKLVAGLQLQRSIYHRAHLTWSTAQTLQLARERWMETAQIITGENAEGEKAAPWIQHYLRRRLRGQALSRGINYGAGSSAIYWANNSRISPFTPGPQSGDGGKGDLLVFDEAMAFTLEAGTEMLGSILPGTVTRPWRQVWIISTRGTVASTWLNDWIARGRLAVDDPDSPIAYFEWAADPDADPYDPATLAGCHPAFGITQSVETLAEFMAGPRSIWERAFLNRETPLADETIIPLDVWDAPCDPVDVPHDVHLAFDVARDRSAATIAAAWRVDADRVHAIIVETRPGLAWLPAAMRRLTPRGSGGNFTADPTGPTLTVVDALPSDIEVRRLTPGEYSTACQSWFDRTHQQTATHTDSPGLRTALSSAAITIRGGKVALDPDKSAGPIDQLRALALATAAAATQPTEVQVF